MYIIGCYSIFIITGVVQVVTLIKCVEPFATGIKMKSTHQEANLAKSSDQQVVQTGDKHIRGAILSKPAFIRPFEIKRSR